MIKLTILVSYIALIFNTYSYGQSIISISGNISNKNSNSLNGAYIEISSNNMVAFTDQNGNFTISVPNGGTYTIKISHIGYETLFDTINVESSIRLNYTMEESDVCLHEVVVEDHYHNNTSGEQSLSVEYISTDYLEQNREGSLMKSLERLPGITTIDIGSGQSKPLIRGLGFNRVVVVENGIKHEGQQWGADHGLEIDQYAVNNIEILKGPASLTFGADAIGGVINIMQNEVPTQKSVTGNIELTGKTNNNYIGTSVAVAGRNRKLFASFRATFIDYADYKVPATHVDIYSFRIPLYNNTLRNTAGNERNFTANIGYISDHFTAKVYVSNFYGKSGFFANAHGKEPRSINEALHDAGNRDIQNPYGEVNHFKIISKNNWLYSKFKLDANVGFQSNFRQEWSDYTPHGNMPRVFPSSLNMNQNLERGFEKYIYSTSVNAKYELNNKLLISSGLSSEYHENYISGIGFIIPQFTQANGGAYMVAKYEYSDRSIFNAGIRYDYGIINTKEYYDWFATTIVQSSDTTYDYLQRSENISRSFANVSWAIGYNLNIDKFELKANAGKSFRMPIAKELAANGVNYHHFSYEKGDANLKSEESYQFDLGLEYSNSDFAVGITPFVNYFVNYIYLNPTHRHDRQYGNGNQVFEYTQCEVFRYGGELHSHYRILPVLQFGIIGEYVYSEQMSGAKKGYTLPFSPPASAIFNIKYNKTKLWYLHKMYVTTDLKLVASQTDIVPPESITEGYKIINAGAGFSVYAGKQIINLTIHVNNIFNTKYFNHTSFYRLINLPEAGRNFIVGLSIPFSTNNYNTVNYQ